MDKRTEVDDDSVNRLDSWLSPVVNLKMTYKGQKESLDDLPKSDNKLGDAYYVVSEEKQYAYNGMTWELIDDTHGDGEIESAINYKGVKSAASELPLEGNENGDAYYVTEDSSMYVWNGTSWDSLGNIMPPVTSVEWDDITGKPDVFYEHPENTLGVKPTGFYKVGTDEYGHVTSVEDVTMDDLVDIGVVRLDGDKLVKGEESVSDLSLVHDAGTAVSMTADDGIAAVEIVDDSGKTLPIMVSNGEAYVGKDTSPADYIYTEDIDDIESADGKLVPNLNTVKQYVDGIDTGIDEAIENAENAVNAANEAINTAKNLPKISGGYGPPVLGGVSGDLYVDYNTGDIYEFGNNETV